MANPTLTNPPYGNCAIQAPDGEVLCRCDEKKIRWYLSRDLAELVCERPRTIRLRFEPKGRGHAGDAFYIADRENRCVVCGRREGLTKHHVVPSCYRAHFPDRVKGHSSHDVVPICDVCHGRYEAYSLSRKKELASRYDAPLAPPQEVDGPLHRARKAAWALLEHGDRIPAARRRELRRTVREFLGLARVGRVHFERVIARSARSVPPGWVDHGERVVARIPDLDAFVIAWREHFVATMNPRFLAEHWDAGRPAFRES